MHRKDIESVYGLLMPSFQRERGPLDGRGLWRDLRRDIGLGGSNLEPASR
jgi:hypothetical protein